MFEFKCCAYCTVPLIGFAEHQYHTLEAECIEWCGFAIAPTSAQAQCQAGRPSYQFTVDGGVQAALCESDGAYSRKHHLATANSGTIGHVGRYCLFRFPRRPPDPCSIRIRMFPFGFPQEFSESLHGCFHRRNRTRAKPATTESRILPGRRPGRVRIARSAGNGSSGISMRRTVRRGFSPWQRCCRIFDTSHRSIGMALASRTMAGPRIGPSHGRATRGFPTTSMRLSTFAKLLGRGSAAWVPDRRSRKACGYEWRALRRSLSWRAKYLGALFIGGTTRLPGAGGSGRGRVACRRETEASATGGAGASRWKRRARSPAGSVDRWRSAGRALHGARREARAPGKMGFHVRGIRAAGGPPTPDRVAATMCRTTGNAVETRSRVSAGPPTGANPANPRSCGMLRKGRRQRDPVRDRGSRARVKRFVPRFVSGPRFRIAADIGGTFTDLALIADDGITATWKALSTPEDYAAAVIAGIKALTRSRSLQLDQVGEVLHGCTVATNAILERKGARTALVTTRGFRDLLELRRIRVPRLYEPLYVKPEPLVPRPSLPGGQRANRCAR